MRYHQILALAAFTASTTTYAEPKFSVTVTDGPTQCADNEKVKQGDFISMHYTGIVDEPSETGRTGKKDIHTTGQKFHGPIGVGQAMKGWDEGIVGLCKGAKATLVIPPDMGYGSSGDVRGVGSATLYFVIEIIEVESNYFKMIDINPIDGFLSKKELNTYFKNIGQPHGAPPDLWENTDKDKDGFICWEEFGGPKGDAPPTLSAPVIVL